MRTSHRFALNTAAMVLFILYASRAEGSGQPVFTREEVAAYQPNDPLRCFRQICLNYNNPTRKKKEFPPNELRAFFSKADPVAYARFCKEINLDAALMLAVPQGGYTTYLQTKVGEPYPGMKGDFFGQTIRELHHQGISAFGYIIIGWNLKYAREHPDVSFGWYPLICLNSPYTDLLCDYSREVLTWYPVDGLRYDILDQPTDCRCPACKKLYRELFGEEMPLRWRDWQTRERFRLASISRCMKRLYRACKTTKPTVAVWQNWYNDDHAADLRDSAFTDVAYVEFANPFRELFLNGILNKGGIITGKMLEQSADRRPCLALGGRCYSYFEVNGKTALPDQTDWFRNDLAPFYAMVSRIEPYLTNASPVPYVGMVFSEATRFRFNNFNRAPYIGLLRRVTEPYLSESLPLSYIAAEDLPQRDLSQFKLLVLAESSGLTDEQLNALRSYVRLGGQLLITGEALSFDSEGNPERDFALAGEMGIHHLGTVSNSWQPETASKWSWRNHLIGKQRAALKVEKAGRQTFSVWMREGGLRIDRFVLTRNPDYRPDGTGPAAINLKDTKPVGDMIVFESDNWEKNIPRGQGAWQVRGDLPGFVGENYMEATPRGTVFKTNVQAAAPEMQYGIDFPAAGNWYVWMREACDSPREDSIYARLQGGDLLTLAFNNSVESLDPMRSANDKGNQRSHITQIDLETQKPSLESAVGPITPVSSTEGRTILATRGKEGLTLPLLHLQSCGKGRIAYLATSQDIGLLRSSIDALIGGMPITVTPRGKQAILTWQETPAAPSTAKHGRWILHLMQEGDYNVDLRSDYAAPKEITGQYPETGWSASLEQSGDGIRIKVSGNARDRLLILQ